MKLNLFLTILVAGFAVTATAGPSAPILNRIAFQVITQTYVDMASGGVNLHAKAQALAAAPSQANLEATQEAWRQMRMSWEASEAFLFGPVDSLGIDPMIDTWPLNRLDLDNVLASGRTLSVDLVRNLGSNLQGYHTVEYLLFGTGDTSNHKDIGEMTPRQLQYLISCTALLQEYSAKLAHAWTTNANPDDASTPGYAQLLANPSLDNEVYPSEQTVLTQVVQGMLGIIDEVANGKLSDPMGADVAHANPQLVESPNSWNSLTDFTDNIRSVLNVYTGEYRGTAGPGIRDVVARSNPALAAQVEARIRQAMVNIQNIAGPEKLDFRHVIVRDDARQRVMATIGDLNSLRGLIEAQVLPIVGR